MNQTGQSEKRLTRDEILRALNHLSGKLPATGKPREIIVMGGAAIVLLYRARESTKDVDALLGDRSIREAARQVAVDLGLPEDWLNDGAKGYVHGLALGDVLLQTPALTVRALAPVQLLAMKLCAWRDDVDISDARLLLLKLGGERAYVWGQVEPYLVPGRELKARYAFDDLWESIHGPA